MEVPVFVGNQAIPRDCNPKGFIEEFEDENMKDYVSVAYILTHYAGYYRNHPETYDLTATDSYSKHPGGKFEDEGNTFFTKESFIDRLVYDITNDLTDVSKSNQVFGAVEAELKR